MCACVCVGLVWVLIAAAAADMVTCSVCVISGYNSYIEVTYHRHALLLFMLSTSRSLLSISQIQVHIMSCQRGWSLESFEPLLCLIKYKLPIEFFFSLLSIHTTINFTKTGNSRAAHKSSLQSLSAPPEWAPGWCGSQPREDDHCCCASTTLPAAVW